MLIRRNSKTFRAIQNIFHTYVDAPDKSRHIRLYITKAGHSLKDKQAIEDLGKEKDFYYSITYETVVQNLDSREYKLYQSDSQPSLYYFVSSSYPDWEATPFELDDYLQSRLREFAKQPIKALKAAADKATKVKQPVSRPPLKRDEVAGRQVRENETDLPAAGQPKARGHEVEKADVNRATGAPSPPPSHKEALLPKAPAIGLVILHESESVLFPELNLTKKDIFEYYDRVSDYILPYLKDRPQFFRWHQSSIYDDHYNKSLESFTKDSNVLIQEWVQTKRLFSVTYEQPRTYYFCLDKNHLLYLIELGCIEVSSWHSRMESIDQPDYIVIDLDPVDVTFGQVIEVAHVARAVLDGLKLPSFIKTSGNKGLHLYIPLDSTSGYEISRKLSEVICKLIHFKIPELTSLARIPNQRKGKIYLNFLQNSRGKSIVAPYSLRPNAFAGVACPLLWEEVKEGLDVKSFTYHSIFDRLRNVGDPFDRLFHNRVNAEQTLVRVIDHYSFLL